MLEGYGIGAALVQRVDDKKVPIAFASRLMTPAEKNYHITEQECLALVWALKKFRPLIYGGQILVVTDHHALCWLTTKRELSGRLARWAMLTQEFQLTIVHKSGRLHSDADALSRCPVDPAEDLIDDEALFTIGLAEGNCGTTNTSNTTEQLRKAQREVPEWKEVIEYMEKNRHGKRKNYEMRDGLLYLRMVEGSKCYSKLCIPPGKFRKDVMEAVHDDLLSGHLGATRTIAKLRHRYYWRKMAEHVRQYVQSCQLCQTRKTPKLKPAGMMQYIETELPFERIGMDVLGPFLASENGNTNIIVAVNYLTKWCETKAVPSATAEAVAHFFTHQIVLKHGAPRALITDQGKCFTARMFKAVLQQLKTEHRTAAAYHSQSVGQVERINHTLAMMLSMFTDDRQSNWDEALPYVTFAYNTTRQESTARTPFYLLYGREPLLPIDVALGANPNPREHVGVPGEPADIMCRHERHANGCENG